LRKSKKQRLGVRDIVSQFGNNRNHNADKGIFCVALSGDGGGKFFYAKRFKMSFHNAF